MRFQFNKQWKKVISLLWIVVLVSTVIWAVVQGYTLQEIGNWTKNLVQRAGVWGPVLYILLYIVRGILFFPATILTGAAGLVFGVWWGVLWTIIGSNLSAWLSFGMTRTLGRPFIEEHQTSWIQKLDTHMKRNGFVTVLLLRLLYMPFDVANYVCGLTSVSFFTYATASAVGMLIGTLLFIYLGNTLMNPWSILIVTFLFALSILIAKIAQKKNKHLEDIAKHVSS